MPPPLNLKGLIFDLDGTLGDTLPICVEAFRLAIEPFAGRLLRDEEILSTFGPSEEGTVKVLAPGNEDIALASYLRHYELLQDQCPTPFEGAGDLLQLAKDRHIRLAVVTGKGRGSADISLRRFGLTDMFEFVEVGSPEGPRKAAGIRRILAEWQLPPERVAYVGDSVSDIRAARECGLFMIAAAWAKMTDAEQLISNKPDLLFTDFRHLRTWFESTVVTERL